MGSTQSGVWFRQYTKGLVLVNAGTSTLTYPWAGPTSGWESISGGGAWNASGPSWSAASGTISLAPQTAVVLKK